MLIVYESNDDDLPRSKYQEYRFSPLFLAMLYPRARLRVVKFKSYITLYLTGCV